MTIRVSLVELKNMEPTLQKLLEQQLPIKTSYRLSKFLKAISKELVELEDQRQKLIHQYGESVEDGNAISITDPEKLAQFQQEFSELLKEEVEFEFDPISIDSLGDNVNLTVAEITNMSILLTDE